MSDLTNEQQVFVLYQIRNWVFGRYGALCAPQRGVGRAWRRGLLLELSGQMLTLARSSAGRCLLHLIAMCRNGEVRFHTAGILRELRA